MYMYMHYIQNRHDQLNVQSHKQMKVCCLGMKTVQRLPTKNEITIGIVGKHEA